MSQNLPLTSTFPMTVQEGAVEHLCRLALEENMEPRLRVAIQGGGCSGFQYSFRFDEEVLDDDLAQRFGQVELVIDPISAMYLQGAVLDYVEDLQGSRFEMKNPIATHTCGCGSSFSV